MILMIAVILFFGIGLHEYAHCKFADMAGDPTPSIYGRVTLNLTKHFEPLGTVMMVLSSVTGYGIGWGRPAPMDSSKMRDPRWDFFMAVIAGPISNVAQAVVYALLAKLAISAGVINTMELRNAFEWDPYAPSTAYFFVFAVRINLSLAIFNMIPLGPLDGHWLVGLLMPERPRLKWFIWNRNYGRGLLIGVILLSQVARRSGYGQYDLFGNFLYPIIDVATRYVLGISLPPGPQ
jgi:Zn-dependent protease